MRYFLGGIFCILICFICLEEQVHALDRRVALLVGHQQGWKDEETLRHVIKGDLKPLQKALSSYGFKVFTLVNQGPNALRRMFARLSKKKMDTFFFYYTGHAGPKAFHLGPRNKNDPPLSYREFRRFFGRKIKSVRRIAIFDACFGARLLRAFKKVRVRLKGPRRQVRRNLLKIFEPMVGKTRGIQLLISSQVYAYEDPRRKASIFTYHLLRGIRGKQAADMDRDGIITVAELFRYAGGRFRAETGGEPSFVDYTIKGVTPYGLIPAYNSTLYIGTRTTGTLSISVGNFVWSRFTLKGNSYRLRTISGKGKVHLRSKGKCFQQEVVFPKNQEIRLTNNWKRASCNSTYIRKKGISLQATVDVSPHRTDRNVSLVPGYSLLRSDLRRSNSFLLDAEFQWGGVLGMGAQWLHGSAENVLSVGGTTIDFSQLALQMTIGYPLRLSGFLHLRAGGYALAGVYLQRSSIRTSLVFVAAGGLQIAFSFRLYQDLHLLFKTRAGLHWLPVTQGNGVSFQFQSGLGLAYDF